MAQHLMTQFASSSSMMSGVLARRMLEFPLGESKRVLAVQQPSGPSTSGGAQSRMALILEANQEQPVCGFVDFVNMEAQVKDFTSARQSYELRYRRPFDVNQDEYDVWLGKLKSAMADLKVTKFSITQDVPQSRESSVQSLPAVPTSSNTTTVVLVALVVVLALGLIASLALK
jgi:hypothetical protein